MLFTTCGCEEAFIWCPAILCVFISGDGLVSIFNMFVMGFIRGAEGEEISES